MKEIEMLGGALIDEAHKRARWDGPKQIFIWGGVGASVGMQCLPIKINVKQQ